jgi:hypothetical protein
MTPDPKMRRGPAPATPDLAKNAADHSERTAESVDAAPCNETCVNACSPASCWFPSCLVEAWQVIA